MATQNLILDFLGLPGNESDLSAVLHIDSDKLNDLGETDQKWSGEMVGLLILSFR